MKRETLNNIIQWLVGHLTQTEYIGLEHVPATGPIILATNHISQLDSVLLFLTPNRADVSALIANKYRKYLFFRWVLDSGGVIWLDRENADFGAVRNAVEFLHTGGALGIAPEGTRSHSRALLEGKPGTALIADKARVPIIPVGVHGTEDGFRKILTLKHPKMIVQYGEPFMIPPMDREDRQSWLKHSTDEIMVRIAAMLPPSYRGFYANHPRLKDLPTPYPA